jgi:pimeloyl-ACP methyl ester carboxylesterase
VTKNSATASPETRHRQFLAAYDALLAGWQPVDVRSRYGTTRVNVCGPEDAPPLMLLHGFGATSAAWCGMAGELSRAWRVHAVDLIGDAGRSVAGGQPIKTAADLTDWIESVRSALGLGSMALCGHSYGGWMALRYALQAPRRVGALALLDPTQCFAGYRPGYLLRSVPLLARPSAARAEAFLRWETGGAPVNPAWLRVAGLAAEVPRARPVRPRRPRRAQLEGLAAATLVVLAERSRAHNIRRVAAGAAASVPDLRVEVLPGASHHSIPVEHSGALAGLLLGFLPGVPAQNGPDQEHV